MIPILREDLPKVQRYGVYLSGLIDLCEWAKRESKSSVAVEVGSYLGESTQIISQYFNTLWCVDPWGNKFKEEPALDVFLKRFPGALDPGGCKTPWNSLVYAVQGTSPGAVSRFGRGIDFVYIDANHNYEPCKRDILAWLSKIDNGIIAGHDYDPVLQPGVVKAVDEVLGKPENLFQDTSWAFVI